MALIPDTKGSQQRLFGSFYVLIRASGLCGYSLNILNKCGSWGGRGSRLSLARQCPGICATYICLKLTRLLLLVRMCCLFPPIHWHLGNNGALRGQVLRTMTDRCRTSRFREPCSTPFSLDPLFISFLLSAANNVQHADIVLSCIWRLFQPYLGWTLLVKIL